jgi:C4-dicarboxylate-binding protein DctP
LKLSGSIGLASAFGSINSSLFHKEAVAAEAAKEIFPLFFKWERPIFPNVSPTYVCRLAHTGPPNPYTVTHHTQAVIFKSVVERATGGKMRVDIIPANQAGTAREIIQQVKDGTLQSSVTAEGDIPIFFPTFNVLSIPYIFKTQSVAWFVLDGWFGKELMTQCLKETGMRCLALAENGGFRHFLNKTRPIHSPKDIAGLKFRVQQNEGHMRVVKALGGQPTPIPMPETYVAVQTNVVDGLEIPIPVINIFKFHEINKYLTLDGHIYGVDVMFVNEKWFQQLPDEYKSIVIEAGYQTVIGSRGACRLQDWEQLAKMETFFKEIYLPTPEERKMFVDASQPDYLNWYHGKYDPKKTWSDKLNKAVNEAEQKIWGKGYIYGS